MPRIAIRISDDKAKQLEIVKNKYDLNAPEVLRFALDLFTSQNIKQEAIKEWKDFYKKELYNIRSSSAKKRWQKVLK